MTHTQTMKDAEAGIAPDTSIPASGDFPDMAPPTQEFKMGVSSNCHQHVIICFDTSGSMGGRKIDESNLAKSELVSVVAAPENKDGFLITAIGFDSGAVRKVFAQSAINLTLPPDSAGGGTNFEAALAECSQAQADFDARPNPDGYLFMRPIVLFMSDGHDRANDNTIKAVHEVADVIAIGFGQDANHKTLGKIASDGQVHVIGTKGGELRAFLSEVGQTLSQSMQSARV